MKRIRVSRPAAEDLDRIWHYGFEKSGSMEVADRLRDQRSAYKTPPE